jgi:hypothetical protein
MTAPVASCRLAPGPCHAEGRGFESLHPLLTKSRSSGVFCCLRSSQPSLSPVVCARLCPIRREVKQCPRTATPRDVGYEKPLRARLRHQRRNGRRRTHATPRAATHLLRAARCIGLRDVGLASPRRSLRTRVASFAVHDRTASMPARGSRPVGSTLLWRHRQPTTDCHRSSVQSVRHSRVVATRLAAPADFAPAPARSVVGRDRSLRRTAEAVADGRHVYARAFGRCRTPLCASVVTSTFVAPAPRTIGKTLRALPPAFP